MSAPGTPISALWFDHKGCGPSELALQLNPFDAEKDGRIPARLGLNVVVFGHADGLPSLVLSAAEALIDGGFLLGREQVDDLHRQIGAWLAATATSPANEAEHTHVVNLTKLAEARKRMTPGDGGVFAIATHAADVLIEVARTLLVYNAAKREAARHRERWSRDWDDVHLQHAHNVADRVLWSSKAAHEAALAKVSL